MFIPGKIRLYSASEVLDMSNNKRSGSFFAGKGYYIALILCVCAIGITGYVFYRGNPGETAPVMEQTQPEEQEALSQTEADVPALATEPRQETAPAATEPSPTTAPTRPPEKKVLKTTSPVTGEEVAGYSMEALSYNQTTRDWRVHDGVDIAAAAGTPVCAAADGVVEAVREDDAMGTTVLIRHDGGYLTCYASLAEEISVESGEAVHMGQVIGCVGSSALLESGLGDHVHFAVTYQDAPMDPAAFLALGK